MQRIIDAVTKLGDNQSLVVGSDGGADLVVSAAGIDRRHARISRRGGAVLVQDLDSHAGTFLNDQEVRGWSEIRPGDCLRLGMIEVLFPGGPSSAVAVQVVPASESIMSVPVAVTAVHAVKKVKSRSKSGDSIRTILNDVSFHLDAGQFLGILGASGSGKSTLIKAIAGLLELSDGAVLLTGQRATPQALRNDRRIAYLPQDVVIHEVLSPVVALSYIARLKGLGAMEAERLSLVQSALDRVGLSDHRHTAIQRLSGGQRNCSAIPC